MPKQSDPDPRLQSKPIKILGKVVFAIPIVFIILNLIYTFFVAEGDDKAVYLIFFFLPTTILGVVAAVVGWRSYMAKSYLSKIILMIISLLFSIFAIGLARVWLD